MHQKNDRTVRVVLYAVFAALAFAATFISHWIPKVSGFLSYDPKDAVIAIGALLFGPLPAIGMTLAASILELVTVSSTGLWGLFMNVVSTTAFVLPGALFYRKEKTFYRAVAGLALGVLSMVAVMALWNYLVTPIYMGVPRDTVKAMLLPVFIPFNASKGGVNAALVMLLYKPVKRALKSSGLIAFPEQPDKTKWLSALLSALALLFFLAGFLFLAGVIG